MGSVVLCCSSSRQEVERPEIESPQEFRRSTYGALDMSSQIAREHQIPPQLVNSYEYKIKRDFVSFCSAQSLEGLKTLIDKQETDLTGFDQLKTNESMQIYLKIGSELNKNCIYSKAFYTLDAEKCGAKDLLHCLIDVESRSEWDLHVSKGEFLQKVSKLLSIVHICVKAPFPYSDRDFVEKRILFKAQNAYYCYFSSVQDHVYPQKRLPNGKSEYVRGQIILGLQVLRREGNQWKLFIATQSDFKISSIPMTLVKMGLPKAQAKWLAKLEETAYAKSQLRQSIKEQRK